MKTIEITEVNEQEYYDILNNENPISGEYEYTASFSGTISVVQLPSGEVIAKIAQEDEELIKRLSQ